MSKQVLITTFNREQIDFILRNHTEFDESEVKIAARRFVELDKQDALRIKREKYIRRLQEDAERRRAEYMIKQLNNRALF